jgi:hypothetical protein
MDNLPVDKETFLGLIEKGIESLTQMKLALSEQPGEVEKADDPASVVPETPSVDSGTPV